MRSWQRLVEFLARTETGTALAAFRIAIGACLALDTAMMIPSGVVGPVLTDQSHGGFRTLHPEHWLVVALGGPTPTTAWTLVIGGLVVGLLLALGLGGRVTALVALQVAMALFDLDPQAGGGHDKLLVNALFLVLLSRSTATLSLDCRLRTGSWTSVRPVHAWPRYLAIYQLLLVYSTTGIQKLGPEWLPFGGWKALYLSLQLPSWQRFAMTWVAHPLVVPLTQAATALTWVFEVSAPVIGLWLWFRHTADRPGRLRRWMLKTDVRRWYVLVGLGMHLGIWATMNVGPFSPVTLSFYFCLWHPDEYAAKWRRLVTGRIAQPASIT